ncbi:hypothetical protein FB451DRAFT_1178833 [Mycena latifolia]|nr:hypothetical protein FB451DRAFT_1178833 [Mycena latifolia]
MLADGDAHGSSLTSSGSDLRSHLVEIEDKMVELESQLAQITSEIFIHSVDNPYFHAIHVPLRLASVCRAWRTIALSTCRLWAHFEPTARHYMGPKIENLANLLQSWLPRASGLPLGLKMEMPAMLSSEPQDAILSIVAKYSSQWTSLDLHSPKPIAFPSGSIRTPLSSLKKLKLAIDWPNDGVCMTAFLDAPLLWDAHLTELSFTQISLPWKQLRNLELFGQSLAQCLEIMEQTPNLESLRFRVGSSFGQPTATSSLRTMSCLRTIKFLSDPHPKLLDYLTLPVLEHLELWRLPLECNARVASLVARSGCSLRTLHLFQTEYYETHDCISNLDSLTEVTLGSPRWTRDEFTKFSETMSESGWFLPALEAFNIDW